MKYVVTNAQMKQAEQLCDRDFIAYSDMMYNAGCAVAERISDSGYAVILAGGGNNGGDGFVAAGRLAAAGVGCAVIMAGGAPRTDCAAKHFELLKSETDVEIISFAEDRERAAAAIARADTAVDCIFGTGFHGRLPDTAAELISLAGSCKRRIAVDVPSGVNSDSGEYDERCFKATGTLVLAAMKTGLLAPSVQNIIGERELLDIGIDESCFIKAGFTARLTDDSLCHPFPPRTRESHKGTFGRLLNIAGSIRYSGAAAISTKAALRSGVGLCTLAAPISAVKIIASSLHETTYLPLPETEEGFAAANAWEAVGELLAKTNAVSIGCGLGNNEGARTLTEYVIRNADCPIIIDADGINSLVGNIDILKERRGETILTPHPAEFSRITGTPVPLIQARRIESARSFAAEYGVTLVLKGSDTVIASKDGELFVNIVGNAGLAKGGSGDALTGIIGSMAAQGVEPFTAAASGVYCHARAADILAEEMPMLSMLITDVIDVLPRVYGGEGAQGAGT